MKLVFDHKMFGHINSAREQEYGQPSRVFAIVERLLKIRIIVIALSLFEHSLSLILTLPIPIYSSIVYAFVTNARGLPRYGGMYLRALYYRRKLGSMEPNVFIDQNVFFAYPKSVELKEFSYIDKGVIIMSKTAKVGRRVHIAPKVFISGGGHFEIEDYACIATNSSIITSTEVLKNGARCCGPMVNPVQRNCIRGGKVLIKKDAFIAANVTILPNVTIEEGSVAAVGSVITKSTQPWRIYSAAKTEASKMRDKVCWPDD